MKVEIYSDTVCPWCYIGKRRFERAVRMRPDLELEVHWLPFELNPGLPATGIERESYLARKFGDLERVHAMQAQLRELGASLGIEFHFERARRMPNTRASHEVLQYARAGGAQDRVSEALFKAYFEDGSDIGDRARLIEIGASAGLDAADLEHALVARRHASEVEALERQAHDWGITGVPTFIFDRNYAVSGAQETDVFLQVFDRLRRLARAS
ncbi:MAG TPA: DsbA family oxidoreductase [Steroidobacteraceae bacterium]|nr:DsbA family oxidoreductase [Steroidobacteraceae bacterium]